ncbi:protein transporter sec-13 [Microthyrium microscopicum]|uniref:Protein transport protein SEC13 n=1 Tax=Microthyrium microscopicum TaxID=703497 RepID=A0A6A6U7C3_9PEZI|nr:protein transporter sec-13 [Microthyrium microscopicum]
MAAQVISNSGHDEPIHDAVLDYYGRRLATCSSDKTIKIFEIDGDTHRLSETIRAHAGPVWSVAWAHPKFGTLLASSSFAGTVLVHREAAQNQWALAHSSNTHSASVNLVAWAPHEAGCLLAAASSDGSVSVLELVGGGQQPGFVQIAHFAAHPLGANSVSWSPSLAAGSLSSGAPGAATQPVRRFVTGGSDCLVKIWELAAGQAGGAQPVEATLVSTLTGHTDWVRDVAWSTTVLRKTYIASASQDKTVRVWTSENGSDWTSVTLPVFPEVVWRVSWSLSGNVLAVSTGDNRVSLWKEKLTGVWDLVKTVEE